jgi:retron-type reverse transcriptase
LAVGIDQRKVNWILDADIAGFFDAVSHDWLIKFVEHRVGDRRVVGLIRKWLKAGVAEDGQVTPGEVGTPQGAVISPLLANIYLHYVFDLWADQWRQRHAHGDVIMVRGACPWRRPGLTTLSLASSTRPTPSGSGRTCGRVWRNSP